MTSDRNPGEASQIRPFIATTAHCVLDTPAPITAEADLEALFMRHTDRAASPNNPEGVKADIESVRLDAVADDLLGGSLNSCIDREFTRGLVAEFPQVPGLARTAAGWNRDAAQAMLDRGIRAFVVLGMGSGGLPITAGPSTLSTLYGAGARVVVIEHDLVTRQFHDLSDQCAGVHRAVVLCLRADQHRHLADHPVVAQLLADGEPVGILATALLRPRDLHLAAILAVLDAAAPNSLLALTQLTSHSHDGTAAEVAGLAARFEQADVPIAVETHSIVEELLGERTHQTTDTDDFPDPGSDSAASALTTVLLTSRRCGGAPGSLAQAGTAEHGHSRCGIVMTVRQRSAAALIPHLTGLFFAGLACLLFCTFVRTFADVRCASQAGTGWCSPVSLHLAQFLPAYATGVALLIGCTVGTRWLRTNRNLAPVITLDWLILATAVFVAVLLG